MSRLRVETGRRFVKHEKLGSVEQAARDHQPSLHTAGKLADLLVPLLGQFHELEQLDGFGTCDPRFDPVVARVDQEVVEDGDLLVQIVLLGHHGHTGLDTPRFRNDRHTENIESSPADGGIAHEIMRIVVVFPAPFGPRKPKHVCVGTSKEIDLTASSLS